MICPICKKNTNNKKYCSQICYGKSLIKGSLVVDGFKKCSKCQKIQPINKFWNDKHKKDGLKSSCVECESKFQQQWNNKNKKNNSLKAIKRTYGVNINEAQILYQKRLIEKCYICGISAKESGGKNPGMLYIDHEHNTGKIRGFLCDACNRGLGYFTDSVLKLENAITYLKNEY